MSEIKLIADSGSTKTEWCLLKGKNPVIFSSQGMSPYFLDKNGIADILHKEVVVNLKDIKKIDKVYFFGTGCKSAVNAKMIQKELIKIFVNAKVKVESDLLGAAVSLCGNGKGIACILGTGSNSCYFNGKRIVKNSPGLGFILGDEASGAYLGKKVIQHYLYDIFEPDLKALFDAKYVTNSIEIIEAVYKKPLPNRYLASFALFLSENRGHYMVENIIEDGIIDFFNAHILRYENIKKLPIHFTGSIAFGFQDVIRKIIDANGLMLGNIFKTPMEGLINYYRE